MNENKRNKPEVVGNKSNPMESLRKSAIRDRMRFRDIMHELRMSRISGGSDMSPVKDRMNMTLVQLFHMFSKISEDSSIESFRKALNDSLDDLEKIDKKIIDKDINV